MINSVKKCKESVLNGIDGKQRAHTQSHKHQAKRIQERTAVVHTNTMVQVAHGKGMLGLKSETGYAWTRSYMSNIAGQGTEALHQTYWEASNLPMKKSQ